MLIKEAVYKRCTCGCSLGVESEAVYGCDQCNKVIEPHLDGRDSETLRLTVFYRDDSKGRDGAVDLRFCSWTCLFEYLHKTDCDHFIGLPHLLCGDRDSAWGLRGLLEYVKQPK